jgi:hypothetical protein
MDMQMNTSKSTRKHFLYKHPLFRKTRTRQGIWYESSPYYLWWRYLRLNEVYKQMCLGNIAPNDTHTAFQNIHAYDDTREGFANWFRTVGEDLFCELKNPNIVKELYAEDNIHAWTDDSRVLVSIPVSQNTEWVMKQLNRIVTKHRDAEERRLEKGKPQSSSALYTFAQEPDVPALKRYLAIYELHTSKTAAGRKRSYMDTGSAYFGNKVQPESAKSMAYRMVKTARQIIENTLDGEFPKFRVRQ